MRTRSTALFASCALLLVPALILAQSAASGTEADAQAIRALFAQQDSAFNKRDIKSMIAALADEYQEIDQAGSHSVHDRATVEFQWTANVATLPPAITRSGKVTLLKWLAPQVALVEGTWMSMGNGTTSGVTKGTWMAVVRKRDGAWKIVSELAADDN